MEELADVAIKTGLDLGMSFVDIRIENTKNVRVEVINGVTEKALIANIKGAGIRAFVEGSWTFGHTSDLTPAGIKKTVESLSHMATATTRWVDTAFEVDAPTFSGTSSYQAKKPINRVTLEDKIALAQTIDEQLHAFDNRVMSTRVIYRDSWTDLYVANSLQTKIQQETGRIVLIPFCTAKEGTNTQRVHVAWGLTGGLGDISSDALERLCTEPAEIAIDLLESVSVKGGVYDVIADPVLNGGMVHEAFGHACEGDNHTAGSSVLEGKMGSQVGPESVNITDDPTIEHHVGSYEYDWEGTKTQRRELVKDGILSEFLHDIDSASQLKMQPNGAARAQSFMFPPIPRMSNTFMEPGDWKLDELIEDTKKGVMMYNVNYGYTDSSKGQFMFQASHGYLVENGEKTQMIRDASIAGLITEILWKIDGICDDFSYDAGSCGTQGQTALVMSGGPHVRIRDVPVGGA